MREILFRAKDTNTRQWVEGCIVRYVDCAGSIYIMHVPPKDPDDTNHAYSVIPETVGQYTGLKDKNGRKIFEGDIVIAKSVIENNTSVYKINFSKTDAWFGFESLNGGALFSLNELLEKELGDEIEIEVIENIHDNPGLLEVE